MTEERGLRQRMTFVPKNEVCQNGPGLSEGTRFVTWDKDYDIIGRCL